MKYKILVSGNNPSLIMDFIQHTGTFFNSLSTTPCMRDIIGHFELFGPDAYVCFVNSEHSSILTQINALKRDEAYNGASIFLIGDAKTCDELAKNLMFSAEADLIIRRPISVDNLVLRITRYFDEKKEAQAEEEARKTPAEAKTAADIAKEKEEEKAAAAKKSERKHVLVIDDDRIILKMLKEALSDEYDVTTMVNGVAAEKFLEAKNVDLVILDYEMPIETGADIFRRIKANPKISHIPVCFLTGISEREKIMEVMALKPHGYLLKPIDMDMLIATVSNLTN
ncbi:MAG: response regulator [Oscillospiraceae bacterium]|nr:response regulator [Oscillospiraceae bacterium]